MCAHGFIGNCIQQTGRVFLRNASSSFTIQISTRSFVRFSGIEYAINKYPSTSKVALVSESSFPLRWSVFGTQQRRSKYKKRDKVDEHEDDDENDEDLYDEEPGSKIVTGHMASLRADLVLKTGLGISRNKIETLFYESKIRVNGSKIPKKSQKVHIGDELDVIKGPSPVNEAMILVSRVTIISAKENDDGDKIVVKMRRYKSLTLENTEN